MCVVLNAPMCRFYVLLSDDKPSFTATYISTSFYPLNFSLILCLIHIIVAVCTLIMFFVITIFRDLCVSFTSCVSVTVTFS